MIDEPAPSDEQPAAYEVGYGKPPVRHRFTKGQSGNPRGRPKASAKQQKSTSLDFGAQPANSFLLEEAYRPVTVREGDRVRELPTIQAVFRVMGMSAIKGNRFAQRTLAELVQAVEEQDRKLRSDHMGTAIEYKRDWTEAIEHARSHGLPEPQPLPHPDDVIIDLRDATVKYAGPMTPEEKKRFDSVIIRRDEAQSEVSKFAELHRKARNPQKKETYLREWLFEQKMFDIVNDNLPPRFRTKLLNRSYATDASREGSKKRRSWPGE